MPAPLPDDDPESPKRQRRTERLVLAALAAVQFTTIVDFMVVMPLGPQLMRSLHITPAQFGMIVSSYTFAAGVAGIVAATFVDRYSRRTAFVCLYAGFLVGTLCCAIAPTYHLLVAARVATGACGGVLGGMSMAIIGDVFPDHRRGRATGLLMSAFATASIAGVPLGLRLGVTFGWHVPFVALVVLGVPVLALAMYALPPLRDHVGQSQQRPLASLVSTFTEPNHIRAFALIATLMIGSFTVVPYISAYLVANLGIAERRLDLFYIVGGMLTLWTSPIIGRLADRYGKLTVYRIVAPASAALLVIITHLESVPLPAAIAIFGLLLVANSGRMIPAMAMITGSVAPHRRGGFMSANSSVQHIACGIGAYIGGLIITQQSPAAPLENYGTVGWIACGTTLASIWLAARVRLAEESPVLAEPLSLPAAAEAMCDADEPLIAAPVKA
jgi:DHA1 family inner membrane transport protein